MEHFFCPVVCDHAIRDLLGVEMKTEIAWRGWSESSLARSWELMVMGIPSCVLASRGLFPPVAFASLIIVKLFSSLLECCC